MNIIKLENVGRVTPFLNKLEIGSNYHAKEKFSYMVVLSEDDINNSNSFIKLKDISISILLLPKKYKFTFNDTEMGKLVLTNLDSKSIISYY